MKIIWLLLCVLAVACPAQAFLHGDLNDDKRITIDEVVSIINGVLLCDFGCHQDECECQEFLTCGVSFCADTQAQFDRCVRLVEE